MTEPNLKPGNQSSEYRGKVTAQLLLAALALINTVLEAFGLAPVVIEPDTAALAAVGLEALWTVFRQTNKALEIRAQSAVRVAELNQTKEPQ